MIKFFLTHKMLRIISSILGLVTIACASFFITGYIFDKPGLYNWGMLAPVALPSAVLFLLIGIAITILSMRNVHKSEKLEN